jgi:hypothetical protein
MSAAILVNRVARLGLAALLLGVMAGCGQGQPAKSPESASSAGKDAPAAPPPAKAEKQQNDGSGSGSPLPESKNEPVLPLQTRRDPEEWSQVNLLCGPSPRRDAAALWP